ncbi:hypothetical protein LJC56_11255 [Christensenellaceae bacterium OttesenSCG-928-K19]|nr:hypothetical protein [Christensenellaceae bacterium OttesenSCG-928-K19]
MAKNLILYFSGTGNSLTVAKQIAQELGDTELNAMAACPTPVGQFDRVGFVAPNYAGGLPRFVGTYLGTLDFIKLHTDYFFLWRHMAAYLATQSRRRMNCCKVRVRH